MDARGLENALGSPLRLRLVAELLEADEHGLSTREAVRRTGRHRNDVIACLRPMVSWGLLEPIDDGMAWRLRDDMDAELHDTLITVLRKRDDFVSRERSVRHNTLCGMIGVDPKMLMVFEMIQQVARLDVPVLITGETGTGKELVAKAIHELSAVRSKHFGAVNCATLSEELFASEMFGHVKGAFTGAHRDHIGLFEQCNGGTLFLDEVGELTLANQVKLLRVLQEHKFTRVGDERVRDSDFRIICATNRDLVKMAHESSFREDLYYRLNVFPMQLPSLRERPEDLPYLIDEMLGGKLARYNQSADPPRISTAAMATLRNHTWPGNVRELENVLMRALIVANEGTIDLQHLPPLESRLTDADTPGGPSGGGLRSLADVEADHIRYVVTELEGNISAAAATLGVSRTTLYKKMRTYDIKA